MLIFFFWAYVLPLFYQNFSLLIDYPCFYEFFCDFLNIFSSRNVGKRCKNSNQVSLPINQRNRSKTTQLEVEDGLKKGKQAGFILGLELKFSLIWPSSCIRRLLIQLKLKAQEQTRPVSYLAQMIQASTCRTVATCCTMELATCHTVTGPRVGQCKSHVSRYDKVKFYIVKGPCVVQ